jgi:hypothetical protein
MSEELKPCPFCKKNGNEIVTKKDINTLLFYTSCRNCRTTRGLYPTKEASEKAWNERPLELVGQSQSAKEVAELIRDCRKEIALYSQRNEFELREVLESFDARAKLLLGKG